MVVMKAFTRKVVDLRCHWTDLPRQVRARGTASWDASLWLAQQARWGGPGCPSRLLWMTRVSTERCISGTDSVGSASGRRRLKYYPMQGLCRFRSPLNFPDPSDYVFNEIRDTSRLLIQYFDNKALIPCFP